MNKILKRDHPNESYRAIYPGAIPYAAQSGSKFETVDKILKYGHLNESY